MIKKILNLKRLYKQLIVFFNDIIIVFFTTWLAFTIRLGSPHYPSEIETYVYFIAILSLTPFLFLFNIYKIIFRYGGIEAIRSIFFATICHSLLFLFILDYLGLYNVPRSLGIYQPVLFLIVATLNRSVIILIINYFNYYKQRNNILIYGADDVSYKTALSLTSTSQNKIYGFFDSNNNKSVGKKMLGVSIYSYNEIEKLINRFQINQIVLAKSELLRAEMRSVVDDLEKYNVHIKTLKLNAENINTDIKVSDISNIQITDIIGEKIEYRKQFLLNEFKNQIILVTGAGGSIGSELCRQLLFANPDEIILVDNSEFNLFNIVNEIERIKSKNNITTKLKKYLGSVRDYKRMNKIFQDNVPNQVFHAAAYKHVNLVEENIIEGVTNNIFGSKNIIDLSIKVPSVKKFVLISSDKAVRPLNFMGKTKRIVEIYLQTLSKKSKDKKLAIVRFGNVFNSSGSVIPLFQKQIEEGGPVTVTSKNVTRYFMSIPEAVSLILKASIDANKGEIFILDMGKPIKIFDLAKKLIRLSGLKEKLDPDDNGDILIKFTGLKKGEKEHEELLIGDDYQRTENNSIMIVHEPLLEKNVFNDLLKQLKDAVDKENNDDLPEILNKFFDVKIPTIKR